MLRRGHVEFRPRFLRRPRQRGDAFDHVETAAVGDIFLRQQQLDLLQAFAEARLRFVGRDAEPAEFVRQERAREADVEAAAGNPVEHADLARELQRMIEHRQHRPGDEPHAARALRQRRQEDDRVGAVAAVAIEVMLDRARMREAELLGLRGDGEAFGKINVGALLARVDLGKKLHTELHRAAPFKEQAVPRRACSATRRPSPWHRSGSRSSLRARAPARDFP